MDKNALESLSKIDIPDIAKGIVLPDSILMQQINEALAEKLGYKSYTTIPKWESGVSEPTLKKANELARTGKFFGLRIQGDSIALVSINANYGTMYFTNKEIVINRFGLLGRL